MRWGWITPLVTLRSAAVAVALGSVSLLLLNGTAAAFAASASTNAPVFHTSLKTASEAAVSDQSLVMIIFSADWCAPCKLLKSQTLASDEFSQTAGPLHVLDVDVDAEPDTARDFHVEAVPTLVLLTGDEKIVARREGFMSAQELLAWLGEARARAKTGRWEGTAPGSKVSELMTKAGSDALDTNDLARLVGLLGDPNPADREASAKLLIEQREQAVPPLLEALTNSYLGIRIAAAEALRRLAPVAPPLDPWQSPAELSGAIAAVRQWWSATGKLLGTVAGSAEPVAAGSINAALQTLRASDPVKRTQAMSTLVSFGSAALPSVRQAIQSAEATGDRRTIALLEDVRWAILMPDALDERLGGVRNTLARGTGAERQTATARLAQGGRAAIPALAELAEDPNPLVIESATRALAGIGGQDAIPAMAALLKATDSNLRMTAAQSLGHMKDAAAVKFLLPVTRDPDEVVTCAALAALEEISGERNYSPSRKIQPPEVIDALKQCLTDPRWRVRSAAAEVSGKMGVTDLVPELNRMLGDTDGFVIKSALAALQQLSAAPEPQKLVSVAQKQPGLRQDVTGILVKWTTEDAVKALTQLYSTSDVDGQIAILRSLAAGSQVNRDTSIWQPLLAQGVAASAPPLRRAAAESLGAQSPGVAAALVGTVLTDSDPETRLAAAAVVLSIIGGERQVVAASSETVGLSHIVLPSDMETEASSRAGEKARKEPWLTPERLSQWHAALEEEAGRSSNAIPMVAAYVTGSTNVDLPALQRRLGCVDRAGLEKLSRSAAMAALAPRLPWPEGQSIVERLAAHPMLFLKLAACLHKANPGLKDFVLEPARFRAAVDPASPELLQVEMQRLLNGNAQRWSFLSTGTGTLAVVKGLLEATNALWRAAAIYSLGQREDSNPQTLLERALKDTNRWVRGVAVVGITKTVKDRASTEKLLSPLLSDPEEKVAQMACIGLLEPELRLAAGLAFGAAGFEYDKVRVWPEGFQTPTDQRPLSILSDKPSFLEVVRKTMTSTSLPEKAAVPALLLAQYGDFTGLDQLLKLLPRDGRLQETTHQPLLLAAIGLSRESKYLPVIKQMLASSKEQYELSQLLQALKGMSGPEVRELRLEINRRMRQTTQ